MTNPENSGENKVTAPESDMHQKVTAHISIRVR